MFEHVPDWVKENGRFCCWRWTERDGKRTKVPYSPKTGRLAEGLKDYTDWETAHTAMPAFDGIGVAMVNGLSGIDIDHCVLSYEPVSGAVKLTDLAWDVIRTVDCYTELSPSGTGVHILCRTDVWEDRDQYRQTYRFNNRSLGLECYPSGISFRYLTLTGRQILADQTGPFSGRYASYKKILNRYMLKPPAPDNPPPQIQTAGVGTSGLSDQDVVRMASQYGAAADNFQRLWAGQWQGMDRCPSHSEADYELMKILAYWTNRDTAQMDRLFRQSGLMRDKYGRSTYYQNYVINGALRATHKTYTPRSRENRAFGWDDYIG